MEEPLLIWCLSENVMVFALLCYFTKLDSPGHVKETQQIPGNVDYQIATIKLADRNQS